MTAPQGVSNKINDYTPMEAIIFLYSILIVKLSKFHWME